MLEKNNPRISAHNYDELLKFYNRDFEGFIDCKIDFQFDFQPKQLKVLRGNRSIRFINCEFSEGIKLWSYPNEFTFVNCDISYLNVRSSSFRGKMRFRMTNFYDIDFYNTKFEDLADFWRCTFHKKTTFLKTDFLGTTVFSASIFKENVLFTYSLIEKNIIFRGTIFKKGLDLSLAIFPGEASFFDLKLKDFNSYIIETKIGRVLSLEKRSEIYENLYDKAVTKDSRIPIENKTETFRIIKQRLVAQENKITSIPFNAREKRSHFKRKIYSLIPWLALEKSFFQLIWQNLRNFYHWTSSFFEIILLFLNWVSNGHGKSYSRGIFFTLIIAVLSFNFLLATTSDYELSYKVSNWSFNIFNDHYKEFANFILPTHSFSDIGLDPENSTFYIIDIIGRIFVGYGIYQTIQAFRKYK